MRQRCVDLAAHLSQENACSDDNDSDNGGNDGGWDGDWGMGGDEGHCHGDSCTVCEQGQVGGYSFTNTKIILVFTKSLR